MAASSLHVKAVHWTNDEGEKYLLVSDGPDSNSGIVLRCNPGNDYELIASPEDKLILMDFVAFELAKRMTE